MGFGDENDPFHGGHTKALDIEALETNERDEGWHEQNREPDSEWKSTDWNAGDAFWPSSGGGSPHTMALDVDDLESGLERERQKRRDPSDGWGNDEPVARSRRRDPSDGWGDEPDSFDAPDRTMALMEDDFDFKREADGSIKRPERERVEDYRDAGERGPKKGKKSYKGGGQRTKGWRDADEPTSDRPSPAPARHGSKSGGGSELEPHERTMAIDVAEVSGGVSPIKPPPTIQPGAGPSKDIPRTQALDVEELRRGGAPPSGPAAEDLDELEPHERTMALDLSAGAAGLPGAGASGSPPPTQALAPVGGTGPPPSPLPPGSSVGDGDVNKTAMIDPSELLNYGAREADSGGRLVIFVEGSDPVVFPLRPGITSVGREHSNHLVLSDPFCSRKMLRIKKDGEAFNLKTVGDDKKTIINGAAVAEKILSVGDEIVVGGTILRFVIGEPGPADFSWPQMPTPSGNVDALPPGRSGETADVDLGGPPAGPPTMHTPSAAVAPKKKKRGASKILMAILILMILGTLLLALVAIAALLFGDLLFGG